MTECNFVPEYWMVWRGKYIRAPEENIGGGMRQVVSAFIMAELNYGNFVFLGASFKMYRTLLTLLKVRREAREKGGSACEEGVLRGCRGGHYEQQRGHKLVLGAQGINFIRGG